MSKIVIIGGTGYAGGHIRAEAVRRGHSVISVTRTGSSELSPRAESRTGSIEDQGFLSSLFTDSDAVIVSVRAAVDGKSFLVNLVPSLLALAAEHGTRLGFVGGAGSLQIAPGGPRVMDAPEFPEQFKSEASAHSEVLQALRADDTQVDWFYVSPPRVFGSHAPGERTGSYQIGDDVLITDGAGTSEISGADYAIAIIDEIERPTHHRARFTVGY